VTGDDVPEGDMPNSPWPSRWDASPISDVSLSDLRAGAELPPGWPPELRTVAEALAALTAEPTSDELTGEAEALAIFRKRFGVPSRAHRAHRRHASRSPLLSSRAAAAVTVAALGLGGLAAAAYEGALPAPFQNFAHTAFGAPTAPATGGAPGAGGAPAATSAAPLPVSPGPTGPHAAGHSFYGLCNAWEHGHGKKKGVAFRQLVNVAGAGRVAAFCATVPHPGPAKPPHGHGNPPAHPSHREGGNQGGNEGGN